MNKLFVIYLILFLNLTSIIGQNRSNVEICPKVKFSQNDTLITFYNPTFLRYLPYRFRLNFLDTSNIIIETKNISIEKGDDGFYLMNIVDSAYLFGRLSFFKKEDGLKTHLFDYNIGVKDIPTTIFFANHLSGDLIKLDEFRNGRLTAEVINYDISLEFPIKSFTLSLIVNDSLIEIASKGAYITDEQFRYIERSGSKYPVIFKNIQMEKLDGSLKLLTPAVFFIKK
jgi:hypothetical protein